mmetsp:Transcript_29730/g.62616  ORF Transcript_29730/g.62616 Transcript_29730/m.62616 type:complete len:434 (-) Transcript_29730:265-1566(-)
MQTSWLIGVRVQTSTQALSRNRRKKQLHYFTMDFASNNNCNEKAIYSFQQSKQSCIIQEIIHKNMGIMLENDVNIGMRSTQSFTAVMTNKKRGKVLPSILPIHPPSLPPPPSVFVEAKSDYLLCQECPRDSPVSPEEQLLNFVGVGAMLPPTLPMRDYCQGNTAAASNAAVVTPTPEDYANLFFCEPSEEDKEEVRAKIAASSATEHNKSVTKSTFDKPRKKRRRISFGAAIPNFHYLENIPPAHAMTPEERSTRWFSRSDLESFKSSAQVSIVEMRNRILCKSSSSSASENSSNTKSNTSSISECKDRSKFRSMMIALEDETNSSIRGIEHRVIRRLQNRKLLIRDVLECQAHVTGLAGKFRHVMDDKERTALLAKVSQERSSKARCIAWADAKNDCAEVYGSKFDAYDENSKHDDIVPLCKRQKQVSLVSL